MSFVYKNSNKFIKKKIVIYYDILHYFFLVKCSYYCIENVFEKMTNMSLINVNNKNNIYINRKKNSVYIKIYFYKTVIFSLICIRITMILNNIVSFLIFI